MGGGGNGGERFQPCLKKGEIYPFWELFQLWGFCCSEPRMVYATQFSPAGYFKPKFLASDCVRVFPDQALWFFLSLLCFVPADLIRISSLVATSTTGVPKRIRFPGARRRPSTADGLGSNPNPNQPSPQSAAKSEINFFKNEPGSWGKRRV